MAPRRHKAEVQSTRIMSTEIQSPTYFWKPALGSTPIFHSTRKKLVWSSSPKGLIGADDGIDKSASLGNSKQAGWGRHVPYGVQVGQRDRSVLRAHRDFKRRSGHFRVGDHASGTGDGCRGWISGHLCDNICLQASRCSPQML
jgi:hypothetical protein